MESFLIISSITVERRPRSRPSLSGKENSPRPAVVEGWRRQTAAEKRRQSRHLQTPVWGFHHQTD